jgi:hypothetical protein
MSTPNFANVQSGSSVEADTEGLIIVGSDGTEHEFPTGMDPQKAAAVVREQEAFAKQGPMLRSRTGQMYRPPAESGNKEFIEGATGALNPMNLVRGAKALYNDPLGTAKDVAVGVATAPYNLVKGMINEPAHTLGALTGGMIAGHVVPTAPKVIARNLGKTLVTAGTKAEWPMQVAASHQILSGNPAGLAVMAVPPILRKTGNVLKTWGTSAETLKAEADMLLQRGGTAAPKQGVRVNGPAPKDYYKVAQENAAEARAAKAGGGSVDPNGPPAGWPVGVPYDPSKLGPIQPLRKGPALTTLGGGPAPKPAAPPPSVRPLGKAASDLVDGTNPAPRPPVGPQSIMDEMTQRNGNGVSPAAMEADAVLAGENARRVATGDVGGGPAARAAVLAPEAPRPARVVTQEGIPASKSKSPMSNTPGLTRADLEAAGMNPDLNYKNLTPEKIAQIKANRSSRHGTHYANARTDKGLKSLFEDALRNMDPERLR